MLSLFSVYVHLIFNFWKWCQVRLVVMKWHSMYQWKLEIQKHFIPVQLVHNQKKLCDSLNIYTYSDCTVVLFYLRCIDKISLYSKVVIQIHFSQSLLIPTYTYKAAFCLSIYVCILILVYISFHESCQSSYSMTNLCVNFYRRQLDFDCPQ